MFYFNLPIDFSVVENTFQFLEMSIVKCLLVSMCAYKVHICIRMETRDRHQLSFLSFSTCNLIYFIFGTGSPWSSTVRIGRPNSELQPFACPSPRPHPAIAVVIVPATTPRLLCGFGGFNLGSHVCPADTFLAAVSPAFVSFLFKTIKESSWECYHFLMINERLELLHSFSSKLVWSQLRIYPKYQLDFA